MSAQRARPDMGERALVLYEDPPLTEWAHTDSRMVRSCAEDLRLSLELHDETARTSRELWEEESGMNWNAQAVYLDDVSHKAGSLDLIDRAMGEQLLISSEKAYVRWFFISSLKTPRRPPCTVK